VIGTRAAALESFVAAHGGPPRAFLRYRCRQLELILSLSGVRLAGKRVLELGGGVSGQAFLLAGLAAEVVCTDLLEITSEHGGSFEQADRLRRASPTPNLHYVCGRGEAIPIADSSVDVVFSSYVLEHVDDRPATAREIARVLRPGGSAITLVPNVPETVQRALWFATAYAPRQLAKAVLQRTGAARALGIQFAHPPTLRHRVHGSYAGHLEELASSRIGVWDALFSDAGLDIASRFTVGYEGYLGFASPRLTVLLQRALLPFVRAVGETRLGTWLGGGYCFVAVKR